ncbi:hypothetical protein OY671_008235, partial [Metschnikowia pulcherrima]
VAQPHIGVDGGIDGGHGQVDAAGAVEVSVQVARRLSSAVDHHEEQVADADGIALRPGRVGRAHQQVRLSDAAETEVVAQAAIDELDVAARAQVAEIVQGSQQGVGQHGVTEGVYEIAVAPGNPDRLYMATMGRVFRSDDRGLTWSLPSEAAPFPLHFDANSPYRLYGPFMAVSPTDPNVVFSGTPDQGLWRSSDGGANWASVTGVPPAKDIAPAVGKQSPGIAIWFVPSGPRKGAVFAASPGNGLFVAKDAFSDFRAVSEPGYGPETIARGAFASDGAFFAMENERQRAWVLRSDQWTDSADN